MFGDAINLSARLMCKAKRVRGVSDGPIYCDEATYQRSKHSATYEELEAMELKGKKVCG